MSNAYGKSALSASITLLNFDDYLAKIEAAGNSIDEACMAAVDAALPSIKERMKEGAERHKRSGEVVDAIEVQSARASGNYIYGVVGIDMKKHPEAVHAVYQEYGDGHSPEFPDPFVAPAIDNHRAEIKKIERDVLKSKGVPID